MRESLAQQFHRAIMSQSVDVRFVHVSQEPQPPAVDIFKSQSCREKAPRPSALNESWDEGKT
jgi:hypothetical protein